MKNTFNRLFITLPVVCASFSLLSCYQLFQGKIAMNSDGTVSSISSIVTDTATITQLPAPSQIFVSNGLFSDKIQIAWSSVPGAASYRLERAVVTQNGDGSFTAPDESDYDSIKASGNGVLSSDYITGTSYTDDILDDPKYTDKEYTYRFFYRVSAENSYKKYDPSLFTVSEAGSLFAPPSAIKATLGENTDFIKVTWTKSVKASYYRIYRSESPDGTNAAYMGRVTSNQNWYTDDIPASQQGIEYYYTIYAQNGSGNTSTASSVALGYTLVAGAPAKVDGVTVTEGRGTTTDHITVSWKTVPGSSYAVYRTSSTDSAYTLLGSVAANTNEYTTYTDSQSLKTNVYYYYQVQALQTDQDGKVSKGPFSASSSTDKNPAEGYLLSPPSSLTVSKVLNSAPAQCKIQFPVALGAEGCLINSGLTSGYNAYSYKIYGGNTADSITTEISFTPGVPAEGYYTATIESGGFKFFKMNTVNGTTVSADSTVTAPAPYAAKGTAASQRASISGVTDSSANANSSGVYPVKITWNAPDEGADGGYYVYRSTRETTGFRKITEEPVTTLYYVDSNDTAKTGTYYYYKILSLNILLQGTNFSNAATGYGALTYDQYMREYNKTVKQSQKKLTLMHKSGNTAKLGSETISGDISGTLSYDASVQGLGGRVVMHYADYADFYIGSDAALGAYFVLSGNTNTSASMDQSGSMDGTVTCSGMYPGTVDYGSVKIIGGGANGGNYIVTPDGFAPGSVSYTIGNE
jgi:hypothetical protein